jgi:hypothetical protein
MSDALRPHFPVAQTKEIDITAALVRMIRAHDENPAEFPGVVAVDSRAGMHQRRDVGSPEGLRALRREEASPYQPKKVLESLFEHGRYDLLVADHMRGWVKNALPNVSLPPDFWKQLVEQGILGGPTTGQTSEVEANLRTSAIDDVLGI